MNHYQDHTLEEFYPLAMSQINYRVRSETAKDRVRRVERHIIPYFRTTKIKEITPLQLERWQFDLFRLRGADQVRRCKHLFKAILNRAIVYEIIPANPLEAVATIREPRTNQRKIYTRDEVERILNSAVGSVRLMILAIISLGVRSGELVALKFSDINWRNRTITIQRSMRKGELKETKTGQSRTVDIPINLFNELVAYQTQYPTQEYIFIHKNGTPYREASSFVRRHFKPLLERLNIEYKSLYSLRHTYATLQLQGGQSINYVAKQLGHSNARTTQEFYIKYLKNEEDLKRADKILSF